MDMSQIKACIFDLDGTLTDTIRAIAHFGNTALAAYGMEPVSVEDYKIYVGDGRDKLIHRILAARGADTPEMFEKVGAVYDENYEKDWLYDTNVYDGMRSLLDALKERGVKIAVCSNKPDNVAHFVLDSFFGEGYFDVVCGAVKGAPTKPNPYGARKIMKKLNVKPDECLFVGDTNVDIFTAKNAGITSVGALWGFRTRSELIKAGADYIAPKPDVILQLI